MARQFGDLRTEVLKMISEFRVDYPEKNFSAVYDLLASIRESLAPVGQQLGIWETLELNEAIKALDSGLPRLALITAEKAMVIHQLSEAEYQYGLSVKRSQPTISYEAPVDDNLQDILAGQKEAAIALEETESIVAEKLKSTQETTALNLLGAQQKIAAELLKENASIARKMLKIHTNQLERLKIDETKKAAHLYQQEQLISWLSGGYIIENHMPVRSFEKVYIGMDDLQKSDALALKEQQDMTAAALKDNQEKIAATLKENERLHAIDLKAEQEQISVKMRETQTIKMLEKRHSKKQNE